MPRIAVISCFFGDLPWYADYYFHSCGFNPSVDFFLITDADPGIKLPGNVHIVQTTMDAIQQKASKKLGFEVSLAYAYKLCDLKPAYGLIFSDLLEGFDFWGHGDIDVIYGNIRGFMTRRLLQRYDVISVRPEYISGCFTLFRNNASISSLFMESKDYRKVFTETRHFCFDECNFLFNQLQQGVAIKELTSNIESMTHVVMRLAEEGRLRAYFDLHIIEGNPGRLRWQKGRLYYRESFEAMLYHLIRFKNLCLPHEKPLSLPHTFYIGPRRIYTKKSKSIERRGV
ncbi:MAG TPA: DUF6625 family protein [Flavisolibacter sp.]|nr:DUF6625 family protein [Flavisolibacter sp.]